MAELVVVEDSSEGQSEGETFFTEAFDLNDLFYDEHPDNNSILKIFTCKKCWRPLGDSRDVLFMLQDIIVLKAVTKYVEKNVEKVKSLHADHFASTFQLLNCKECSTTIGEFYISTPRLLMYKRDVFSLYLNSIDSYTLEDHDKQFGPQYEDRIVLDSYDYLKEQLLKTQKLLGALQKKFSELDTNAARPYSCSEYVGIPL